MGQSNRPSPSPQSLRNLLRQLKKGAERWSEHPLAHEPQENLRQLAAALRHAPLPQTPVAKSKHKHAGGRPPSLTDEEIASLRAAYRKAEPAIRKRERKQTDVLEDDLRPLLPKHKRRSISDSTLRRIVVCRPRRG